MLRCCVPAASQRDSETRLIGGERPERKITGNLHHDTFASGSEYTGTGLRDNDANISIRNYAAGTGNAVTDLIFSIAKRDVTFFSGTAPINFL